MTVSQLLYVPEVAGVKVVLDDDPRLVGGGGGGGSTLTIVTKSANYTAAGGEFVVVDATAGPVTITAPAAPAANTVFAVKKSDASANMVVVGPGAGATINGDTAAGLPVAGAVITLQFDGTDWQMISTGTVNSVNPLSGLPTGGTTGQVLRKNSSTDYDAAWGTPTGLVPTGGTTGQVLTKSSGTDYAASWSTPTVPVSAAFPAWVPGRQFGPPMCMNGTLTSTNLSTSFKYFFPVQVPNPCTLSSLSVAWHSASGSTGSGNVGIYESLASGLPGARLFGGNINVTTGTTDWVVVSGLGLAVASPRLLWVMLACGTTTTFRGPVATSAVTNSVLPGGTMGNPGIASMYTGISLTLDMTGVAAGGVYSGAQPPLLFTIA